MSQPNVYDQAHVLARAVKASPEYTSYRLAAAGLDSSKSAREMLRDFRRRQFELQSRLLQGEEISEAEQERFGKLSELVSGHPIVTSFMQAEYHLSRLLSDIQKIIADAVEIEFDDEDEVADAEGGDEDAEGHDAGEDEDTGETPKH